MTPPLVSIIIPCYNAGRWLAATLESALGQSYPHCEIIVVDDGSTDDSLKVARSFSARGLLVFSQANAGQCAACNHAFRQAKGSFIKYLDADDLLSPDAVAIQVAALVTRPSGRLAYGEWARFHRGPTEAVFQPRPGWHDSDSPADWICETWRDTEPMYQCALWLIPRDLITRAGGWDERLSLINDFEFFTRLVLASSGIVHTPGARLYYRSGLPGSLSQRTSRRAVESAWLSTSASVRALLATEDSTRTRRVSADMLQAFVFAYYPVAPDLMDLALAEVDRLGGSTRQPQGGRLFHLFRRLFGWRTALLIRRRPARSSR
jgi:glycosyltransferase involved in cell wall biosynthesis